MKVKVIQPRPEGNPYLPAEDEAEIDAAVATSLAASGLVEIVDNKPNAKTAKEEKE
jgi:hypothetical protein